MKPNTVPHLAVVVGACVAAIIGYSIFSGWAVFYSDDAAMRGDVIGTWKSFAVLAFGFWLGSSSGGKAAANDNQPTPVVVDQPPEKPVPMREIPEPEFARFDDEPAKP